MDCVKHQVGATWWTCETGSRWLMLLERTLCVYDKVLDNMLAITSGADKGNDMGKGTPVLAMSLWWLAYRYTHLSVSTVYSCKICTWNLCVNAYITTPGRTSNPYTYKCIHTCTCVHTSAWLYVCIYVFINIYINIHIYIYIYLYEGDFCSLLVHFDTFFNMHKGLFFWVQKDCPNFNSTWNPCHKWLQRLPTVRDDFHITTRLLTW